MFVLRREIKKYILKNADTDDDDVDDDAWSSSVDSANQVSE